MPTYDLDSTTNIAATGNAPGFIVNNKESLELAAGGVIKAEAGPGIDFRGVALLTIKGQVESAQNYAILSSVGTPAPALTLHIAASGIVKGQLGVATGVGGESSFSLINEGRIEAALEAISIGNTSSLTNTGTIVGNIVASGLSATGMVVNAGFIDGDLDWHGGGRVIIDNRHGTISGSIKLSSDTRSTFYGGAGAEDVSLGTGSDSIDAGGGNDIIRNCGEGLDTVIGGGGNDTAIFKSASGNYTLTHTGATEAHVSLNASPDVNATNLKDVRFLQFTDKTVMLYNAAPDQVALSASSVAENTPTGTAVATVSARDADGDAVSFTLADPTGTFVLDGTNVRLAKPLDYETGPHQYSLTLTAKDAYGAATARTVSLAVGDVADSPVPPGGGGSSAGTPTGPADLTLIGTSRAERLTGAEGNDTLSGLARNDVLQGLSGNDRLDGGTGKDVLTGGAGRDTFVFSTKFSTKTNRDKITDFSVKDDTLWLDNALFKANKSLSATIKKGSEAKPAKLASKFFRLDKAKDKDDFFIYDRKKGVLSYDEDGSGSHKAVEIASLKKGLKLTYHDFFFI